MGNKVSDPEKHNVLQPYISGLGAWALAVGTSIGWGSLVVTNSDYLANAGPAGSVIGMLVGTLIMLIMVKNFFGNMTSLSRLFYALARDRVLPARFAVLNKKGIPVNAILLVMALFIVIPFVGRTAISWIVDVATIGATLL